MNILQIGTTDRIGGAASISWALKKGLEKKGYGMPMFVADKHSTDADVVVIPRKVHKYFQIILSNDIDYSKTDWILDTKEFREADVVHLHNLHGWFLNLETVEKISNVKPVVWTLHDMWAITSHCAHSYKGELQDGFYQCPSLRSYPRIAWHNERYLARRKREIYSNANIEIVTPSVWLQKKVAQSVLKDKTIHVVPNGIDTDIFKKIKKHDARKRLDIPHDKKILLFVSDNGKNNPYKGWQYMQKVLSTFTKKSDVHFVCIGGVANVVGNRDANITYVSHIADPLILAHYYAAADIFLYPTLADSFGLVVAEAMACGTPVLTFETGGVPELVTHKVNGYVARYADTNDLLAGLEYLLSLSEDEINRVSENSIQKIKDFFTKETMLEKYIEIYHSLTTQ